MPRVIGFVLAAIRIAVVWLAFAGTGSVLKKHVGWIGRIRVPSLLYGILFYIVTAYVLSLFHILLPGLLTLLLASGAIAFLISMRNKKLSISHSPPILSILLVCITFILLVSNCLRASRPNVHSDPMITYAVQPDRWLNEGKIYFLEETKFSLMPQVGEVVSLWPAALASDRMDRLSLLQLFQMSMLIAALVYGWYILCRQRDLQTLLLILSVGLASAKLSGWGALAKIDMTLIFFCTAALSHIVLYRRSKGNNLLAAFMLLGLATATKHTAWMLLPVIILMAGSGFWKQGSRKILLSIILLIIPPIAYFARCYIHSGMLMFPNRLPFMSGVPYWKSVFVPSLSVLENYSGVGILTNIKDLLSGWSLPGIIFLLGMFELIRTRRFKQASILVVSVLIYGTLCIVMFNPVEWGSKYTILMMPFMVCIGASTLSLSRYRKIAYYLSILFIVLSSSLLPRIAFSTNFIVDPNPLHFDSDLYHSPRNIQLIANDLLRDRNVKLLSLFSGERYFSDFPVYCARTYPFARRLFTAHGMDEEMEILHELGITHVYFNPNDPMEMGLQNLNYWNPPADRADPALDLEFIRHVGEAPGLTPLATDGRYVLYKIEFE